MLGQGRDLLGQVHEVLPCRVVGFSDQRFQGTTQTARSMKSSRRAGRARRTRTAPTRRRPRRCPAPSIRPRSRFRRGRRDRRERAAELAARREVRDQEALAIRIVGVLLRHPIAGGFGELETDPVSRLGGHFEEAATGAVARELGFREALGIEGEVGRREARIEVFVLGARELGLEDNGQGVVSGGAPTGIVAHARSAVRADHALDQQARLRSGGIGLGQLEAHRGRARLRLEAFALGERRRLARGQPDVGRRRATRHEGESERGLELRGRHEEPHGRGFTGKRRGSLGVALDLDARGQHARLLDELGLLQWIVAGPGRHRDQ